MTTPPTPTPSPETETPSPDSSIPELTSDPAVLLQEVLAKQATELTLPDLEKYVAALRKQRVQFQQAEAEGKPQKGKRSKVPLKAASAEEISSVLDEL